MKFKSLNMNVFPLRSRKAQIVQTQIQGSATDDYEVGRRYSVLLAPAQYPSRLRSSISFFDRGEGRRKTVPTNYYGWFGSGETDDDYMRTVPTTQKFKKRQGTPESTLTTTQYNPGRDEIKNAIGSMILTNAMSPKQPVNIEFTKDANPRDNKDTLVPATYHHGATKITLHKAHRNFYGTPVAIAHELGHHLTLDNSYDNFRREYSLRHRKEMTKDGLAEGLSQFSNSNPYSTNKRKFRELYESLTYGTAAPTKYAEKDIKERMAESYALLPIGKLRKDNPVEHAILVTRHGIRDMGSRILHAADIKTRQSVSEKKLDAMTSPSGLLGFERVERRRFVKPERVVSDELNTSTPKETANYSRADGHPNSKSEYLKYTFKGDTMMDNRRGDLLDLKEQDEPRQYDGLYDRYMRRGIYEVELKPEYLSKHKNPEGSEETTALWLGQKEPIHFDLDAKTKSPGLGTIDIEDKTGFGEGRKAKPRKGAPKHGSSEDVSYYEAKHLSGSDQEGAEEKQEAELDSIFGGD